MLYKIYWMEHHDPYNWGTTEEKGIAKMKELLPTIKVTLDPNGNDGWVECQCEDFFEADNIKEAKKKASDYDVGPSGVFTVFDTYNKQKIFTEEDL